MCVWRGGGGGVEDSKHFSVNINRNMLTFNDSIY